MNWRARVAQWVIKSTLGNPESWFVNWLRGNSGGDEIVVNSVTAQGSAVHQASVNALAQDVAKLPLFLHRRRKDGGRERATNHVAYKLVRQPRPFLTSFTWRETVQTHVTLTGNGYTRIVRDSRMRPTELIPLEPQWVTPMIAEDGTPFYDVRMYGRGGVKRLPYTDIIHIKGRSDNGYCGRSVITRARDVVAADLASANHGRRLYNNGARLAGLLIPKGGATIGKEGRDLAEQQLDERYGKERQYRIGVMGQEFDYKAVGMTNRDGEWVNSRKLARDENASLHRMPPHKVGIMEHATFTNIEHQAQEYVSDTLLPIARRWEEELNLKLLREDEQDEYYFEFNFSVLLRGDLLSRYQAYAIGITNGIINRNEARELENLNKYDGGDDFLTPLNMQGGDAPEEDEDAGEEETPAKVLRLKGK